MAPAGSAARRATNVSLPADLVDEARLLGVNLSQAAEHGLKLAIAEHQSQSWLAENRGAVDSSNAFVEQHGLPLDRHRVF
ncbi:MAG: post-segregation antitoxin CcdA [Rhodocyclaceae bacterium]|nr:post-segregation antitoxin CcdA [Rhodocyclaceae bacterium]